MSLLAWYHLSISCNSKDDISVFTRISCLYFYNTFAAAPSAVCTTCACRPVSDIYCWTPVLYCDNSYLIAAIALFVAVTVLSCAIFMRSTQSCRALLIHFWFAAAMAIFSSGISCLVWPSSVCSVCFLSRIVVSQYHDYLLPPLYFKRLIGSGDVVFKSSQLNLQRLPFFSRSSTNIFTMAMPTPIVSPPGKFAYPGIWTESVALRVISSPILFHNIAKVHWKYNLLKSTRSLLTKTSSPPTTKFLQGP